MEFQRVLHMNSGAGEMSYAQNSRIQRIIIMVTKEERQNIATALYSSRRPAATIAIADLGCGTGPNALLMVTDAVEAVVSECVRDGSPPPEFHVFLNDLPGNDFNSIFRDLPELMRHHHRCFVSAWPGSFYGRLFPADSLDDVVSSSSLHFLSKMLTSASVVNKGRVYIPPAESSSHDQMLLDAYRMQFQSDFFLFLKCRAEELKKGGLLILKFVARSSKEPSTNDCYIWDLLGRALIDMVSMGLVEEEKVDTFNAPNYPPCLGELSHVIEKENSFSTKKMELFEVRREEEEDDDDDDESNFFLHPEKKRRRSSLAEGTTRTIRAVIEPMLGSHFGWEVMDDLFHRYILLLEDYYANNKADLTNVFLALQRK